MEPSIVTITVVVTVVIAVISFTFYWLFKAIAKKAEKVIEEEETIAYVNPLPETVQASATCVVKPIPVRFDNESRVSRNSRAVSNSKSVVVASPSRTSTRQNERYDDLAYANNTTNVTNVTEVIKHDVETPSQPHVIGKGGSFGGAGASAQWDDNNNDDGKRFVAQVVGSAIGSAVVTAVTNSFREETPSYTPREEPTQTYSFDSHRSSSCEPSSPSSSDYCGSSDW